MVRVVPAFLLLLLLAACGLPQVSPDYHGLPRNIDPKHFTCCHDPERYPAVFTDVALTVAQATLAKQSYDYSTIPGLLRGKTAAQAEVQKRLKPLDIVLMANKTYTWGRMVPGRFTHSAVYLGTERELRAMGLWNAPEIVPHHAEIRAGRTLVEALRPAVQLSPLSEIMITDAIVILQPELSLSEKRQAARALVAAIGTPFDFWFDNSTPDTVSCTELIGNAMPELKLTIRTPYGRPATLPDDVAAQAIRGERMRFVAQVRGLKAGGYVVEGADGAMRDIAAFWGPPYQM